MPHDDTVSQDIQNKKDMLVKKMANYKKGMSGGGANSKNRRFTKPSMAKLPKAHVMKAVRAKKMAMMGQQS